MQEYYGEDIIIRESKLDAVSFPLLHDEPYHTNQLIFLEAYQWDWGVLWKSILDLTYLGWRAVITL